MKVLAVNGSPRKKWNTAMLLEKALEGAGSQGAETELIHLYELSFTGCISCFACKMKGGKSYGRCAVKDDLTPVLESVEKIDALILGSPVYFGTVTGEIRAPGPLADPGAKRIWQLDPRSVAATGNQV